MTDETRHDGFADVINLLAAPIAGGIRTVEQFKRGVDEMFRAIENVNRTMENLNEAASRINGLLESIEEPVRVLIPQITRTVKAADEITSMIEGPVRATAPKIERIVDTLGSPGFVGMPAQLGELMQRLGPLAQLAESAGGLFGGFRMPGAGRPAPAQPDTGPAAHAAVEVSKAAAEQAARQHPGTKQTAVKKAPPKKATPAKATPKKTASAVAKRPATPTT